MTCVTVIESKFRHAASLPSVSAPLSRKIDRKKNLLQHVQRQLEIENNSWERSMKTHGSPHELRTGLKQKACSFSVAMSLLQLCLAWPEFGLRSIAWREGRVAETRYFRRKRRQQPSNMCCHRRLLCQGLGLVKG